MDDYFDVIYCINLKRCFDRKIHMIEQFKKIGINKYQFIEGVDKDDPLVKKTMESGMVFNSPPCFRCKKMVCQHDNNKLNPGQIGNWLSYQKIWKDMIKNQYQLSLICEDDLVFLNYTPKVMESVFSPNGKKKYGLRLNQPTLIRLGWLKSSDHQFKGQVRLNKAIKMSNPCHAINLAMAQKLVGHLQQIDCTSDIYIHARIAPKYNHHTVFPPIAYELSYCKDPQFRSEIIPKPRFVDKLLKDFKNIVGVEAKKALSKIIQTEISILPSRKRGRFRNLLSAPKPKSKKIILKKLPAKKLTTKKPSAKKTKKNKKKLLKRPPLYKVK